MQIDLSGELKLWRIGFFQSWNEPSSAELVEDDMGGWQLWFGEISDGDVGDDGSSSRYHELVAPEIDA
jgi:hypothetical protein